MVNDSLDVGSEFWGLAKLWPWLRNLLGCGRERGTPIGVLGELP